MKFVWKSVGPGKTDTAGCHSTEYMQELRWQTRALQSQGFIGVSQGCNENMEKE